MEPSLPAGRRQQLCPRGAMASLQALSALLAQVDELTSRDYSRAESKARYQSLSQRLSHTPGKENMLCTRKERIKS